MCASLPALLPHSLFCAAVLGRKLRGHCRRSRKATHCLQPSLFSVSRCLSEPCAAIDLAGCKRTSANGGDQNRNLPVSLSLTCFFPCLLSFQLIFSPFKLSCSVIFDDFPPSIPHLASRNFFFPSQLRGFHWHYVLITRHAGQLGDANIHAQYAQLINLLISYCSAALQRHLIKLATGALINQC